MHGSEKNSNRIKSKVLGRHILTAEDFLGPTKKHAHRNLTLGSVWIRKKRGEKNKLRKVALIKMLSSIWKTKGKFTGGKIFCDLSPPNGKNAQ